MILPIIENLSSQAVCADFLLAASASSDSIPTWLLIIICVVLFILAGGIGGVVAYNAKLKKLRENKETLNDDDSGEKNTK